MIKLGSNAKDKITGFTGVITAHAKHLYGCDTYGITPAVDKDGKPQDTYWFDEGRIEVLTGGINPEDVQTDKNGADENPKPSRSNPK